MVELHHARALEEISVVRILFQEYQEELGIDLSFQDFAAELANLPGEYAPPHGGLLLGYENTVVVGCVAMRPLAGDTCEMKRLYVRPLFRAKGVGRQLAEGVIAQARSGGYRRMYLDTLSTMQDAQRLYEDLGFRDVPPYRHNPIVGARFLGLDL